MVVVRAGLTKQRAHDALPSIVNALNQQRIIEDCRRNKSKLSAQEHEGLYNKLNNSGFLAPIDSNKTQTNIYNIKKRVIKHDINNKNKGIEMNSQ
jgi:hypothetical protein